MCPLRFAFDRARDLGVPLVVVRAWEVPALHAWSPSDVRDHRGRILAALDALLEPWARDYPDVEVSISAVAEPPANVLLEAGKVAQMLIVGRHTPASRHSGVRLGSTSRSVLHQAGVPVGVIPLPTASRPQGHRVAAPTWAPTWAPTY